jgi:hypothetical protein
MSFEYSPPFREKSHHVFAPRRDPTYRLMGRLALISVGLGILSIVLAFK